MSITKGTITHVSIIVPMFNEEKMILRCFNSLINQSIKNFEIIFVDDGSTDSTVKKLQNEIKKSKKINVTLLQQDHNGPGEARNFGASRARADILVFVDADMVLDKLFVKNIIKPLELKRVIGTDSQHGYLANAENYWARCWNMGKFAAAGNYSSDYLTFLIPDKSNFGNNFRAIMKKDFDKVNGFEPGGDYTDDVSLAKKLGAHSIMANTAKYYHINPDTISEVWLRASWIGAGKNFTSDKQKQMQNLIKFFPLVALVKGIIIGHRFHYLKFVFFKVIHDTAVWTQVVRSII